MEESLEISINLPVPAQRVYEAWLDSAAHTAFTGAKAQIDPQIGGSFTAWEGYISGKTLELQPFSRILQSWRTTEFPENAADSLLEVKFAETAEGCLVTLNHSRIPEGQAAGYEQGWYDYYFDPMQAYFGH
jgi:uncharacterized protein YndB with AHSA1/START domain